MRVYEYEFEPEQDNHDEVEDFADQDNLLYTTIEEENLSSQDIQTAYENSLLPEKEDDEYDEDTEIPEETGVELLTFLLREVYELDGYPINRVTQIIAEKQVIENGREFLDNYLAKLHVADDTIDTILEALEEKKKGFVILDSPLFANVVSIPLLPENPQMDPDTAALTLMGHLQGIFQRYPDAYLNFEMLFDTAL